MSTTLAIEPSFGAGTPVEHPSKELRTLTRTIGSSSDLLNFTLTLPSAATTPLNRSLTQASLESQFSCSSSDLSTSSSSNTSVATTLSCTPGTTPDAVAESNDGSYFIDQHKKQSTPISVYDLYFHSEFPNYKLSSISCPRPPLTSRPRPLTKKEAKREANFQTKVRELYLQALRYEENIARDPVPHAHLVGQLHRLKKDIWEFHMEEICPAPTTPIDEIARSARDAVETVQACVGYLMLLLACWICYIIMSIGLSGSL